MKHGRIFLGIILTVILSAFTFASDLSYDYLKDSHIVNQRIGLSYLEQPAVSRFMDHSLTFMQNGSIDGQSKSQFASLVIPGYFFNLALTVKYDSLIGLQKTTESAGVFSVTDTFSHEKSAAMLTFSQKLPFLPLFYGVNSKVYQETIEDVTMTAVGFDAGVIMKVGGTFIGATYNDINNTNHEWSNGTVDHLKANVSYQVSQTLPFGYVSYVASDLNDDYMKVGLDLFGLIGVESKLMMGDSLNASVSCGINLGAFDVAIRQDFNEVYGNNSQFSMTLHL